jgi:hypothetical protein
MSGPAPAGLFLWAKDLDRLAAFYEAVLGMTRGHTSNELVFLESPGIQLVVHAIPPPVAASIAIEAPPRRRENAAMKFFFAVPDVQVRRCRRTYRTRQH